MKCFSKFLSANLAPKVVPKWAHKPRKSRLGEGLPSGFGTKNRLNFDLVCSCGSWAVLVASWGRLGAVLGPSWGRLGCVLGILGGFLRASWRILGRLGAVLRRLQSVWRRLGARLREIWNRKKKQIPCRISFWIDCGRIPDNRKPIIN